MQQSALLQRLQAKREASQQPPHEFSALPATKPLQQQEVVPRVMGRLQARREASQQPRPEFSALPTAKPPQQQEVARDSVQKSRAPEQLPEDLAKIVRTHSAKARRKTVDDDDDRKAFAKTQQAQRPASSIVPGTNPSQKRPAKGQVQTNARAVATPQQSPSLAPTTAARQILVDRAIVSRSHASTTVDTGNAGATQGGFFPASPGISAFRDKTSLRVDTPSMCLQVGDCTATGAQPAPKRQRLQHGSAESEGSAHGQVPKSLGHAGYQMVLGAVEDTLPLSGLSQAPQVAKPIMALLSGNPPGAVSSDDVTQTLMMNTEFNAALDPVGDQHAHARASEFECESTQVDLPIQVDSPTAAELEAMEAHKRAADRALAGVAAQKERDEQAAIDSAALERAALADRAAEERKAAEEKKAAEEEAAFAAAATLAAEEKKAAEEQAAFEAAATLAAEEEEAAEEKAAAVLAAEKAEAAQAKAMEVELSDAEDSAPAGDASQILALRVKLQRAASDLAVVSEYDGADCLLKSIQETSVECPDEEVAIMCQEKAPLWLTSLNRLADQVGLRTQKVRDLLVQNSPEQMLYEVRTVGVSFGRALQHVCSGQPIESKNAYTLKEELLKFAAAARARNCSCKWGCLCNQAVKQAASAAADMWANFGSVESYAQLLEETMKVTGADTALSGGAAWERMLLEVEIAIRLVNPNIDSIPQILASLMYSSNKDVKDVRAEVAYAVCYTPLMQRVRYIVARVKWALQEQQAFTHEWLQDLRQKKSFACHYPATFTQHHAQLESSHPACNAVFDKALENSMSAAVNPLLHGLEAALIAGCENTSSLLRRSATRTLHDVLEHRQPEATSARQRVKKEMQQRIPNMATMSSETGQSAEDLKAVIQQTFTVLKEKLAVQAVSLAGLTLQLHGRRCIDEAFSTIGFEKEHLISIDEELAGPQAQLRHLEEQMGAVRKCVVTIAEDVQEDSAIV